MLSIGLPTVVGCLAGNLDIVDVALRESCVGDTYEVAVGLHLGYATIASVTHRGAQAAYHLIEHIVHGASCRHSALDSLWNVLLGITLL